MYGGIPCLTAPCTLSQDAIALGVIVGLIWAAVLGWVAGFIKSATEVVYVCFARDLDNRTVTRPDVHDVLKDVPAASGAVVVQPDNNLARPLPPRLSFPSVCPALLFCFRASLFCVPRGLWLWSRCGQQGRMLATPCIMSGERMGPGTCGDASSPCVLRCARMSCVCQ